MNSVSLCMIGVFPPPVRGKTLVNQYMRERLGSVQIEPTLVRLPASLNRKLYENILRARKIIIALFSFLRIMLCDRIDSVYLAFSGGYGQLYDILFLSIARVFGRHIYVHHHSYAYLDRPGLMTRLALLVAGKQTTHITLSENMASKLQSMYPSVNKTLVISNAVFLDSSFIQGKLADFGLQTIGFLSNISKSKGVFSFLDVVAELEKHEIKINALIAGPFEDIQTEKEVKKRLSHLRTVKYVGPKYGDEKTAFYDQIDVLLFPTQYLDEAEPLVILEAMRQGVPVITYKRGCIGDMIKPECGLAINQQEDYISNSVLQLLSWQSSPIEFQTVSNNARKRFTVLHRASEKKLKLLSEQLFLV